MRQPGSTNVAETKLIWNATQAAFVETPSTGKTAQFIKGPLPLEWMSRAGCLPGKTLQVALVLWYISGLKKTKTFPLGTKALATMGVSRDAKYEALARLSDAGLVSITQHPGRTPVVTLLDIH